ncbi:MULTISPECIES: hypothetical protein [Streptomyces]|uniref:hypothetical protein n=1 Tax=Streptomyces TaxID=1883 RepID=UPI001673AC9F|nr:MULTISPECIES: hypothetical protein [Streptomyces]MBD3575924.1 hypothetical protein [Streptomyces sp. KD18]
MRTQGTSTACAIRPTARSVNPQHARQFRPAGWRARHEAGAGGAGRRVRDGVARLLEVHGGWQAGAVCVQAGPLRQQDLCAFVACAAQD